MIHIAVNDSETAYMLLIGSNDKGLWFSRSGDLTTVRDDEPRRTFELVFYGGDGINVAIANKEDATLGTAILQYISSLPLLTRDLISQVARREAP